MKRMESNPKETKTFRGDSYGNLDLEKPAEKESITASKISDSEYSPSHPARYLESEPDKLPAVSTSKSSSYMELEGDNSENINVNVAENQNDSQTIQQENEEVTVNTTEMENQNDSNGGRKEVQQEETDSIHHENGRFDNENISHEEPTHEFEADDEKRETGGSPEIYEATDHYPSEKEVSKTPRERLSVHITKAHEDSDENDDDDDENNDDSDSGAETGNNADIDEDADNGEFFIGRAMIDSARSQTRPQSTSTFREVPGGLRAKANTPASLLTNPAELESLTNLNVQDTNNRGTSREAREEVFQRAMTLMSNRCTSARGQDGELFSDRELPFGIHIPHYFYVQQHKPQPMPPLKVWRGYKGNVYFEPITIQRATTKTSTAEVPRDGRPSEHERRSKSAVSTSTRAPTRATTAGQSTKPYRLVASSPQIYVMDKQAVLSNITDSVPTELKYIEEMESTGSLAVRPYSSGAPLQSRTPTKDPRFLYRREKICKGSNVHPVPRNSSQSAKSTWNVRNTSFGGQRSSNRKQCSFSAGPNRRSKYLDHLSQTLVVSGDKFSPPTVMSPLLRTTTQFSLSNQRAAVTTPDLLGAYDKLPPLEQVRVSIQHMNTNIDNNSRTAPYASPRYTEELKPFIKYSPDVKATYEGINVRFC